MAERIVSPGVFIRENDRSYLPQGIGAIGAAFVGPTTKGRAFIPTDVYSMTDFINQYGDISDDSYLPYAVKYYLASAGVAKIVRIMGLDGYTAQTIGLTLSSSDGVKLIGALHRTRTLPNAPFTGADILEDSGSAFTIQITGSGTIYSASLLSSSPNHIAKIFGTSPKTTIYDDITDAKDYQTTYNYVLFKNYANTQVTADAVALINTASIGLDFSGADYKSYCTAATPWITSQYVSGDTTPLFRFHSFSDGVNRELKISILNVKRAGEVGGSNYGSFDVYVRAYDDTDKQPVIYEQFTGLTLDPTSANYICKVIGTKYQQYNSAEGIIDSIGEYENGSNYVRVEVTEDVENAAMNYNLVPFGFQSFVQPLSSSIDMPVVNYVTTQSLNSVYSSRIFYGFNFDFSTTDNLEYLNPIPAGATTGSNTEFNLDNMNGHPDSGYSGSLSGSSAPLSARKFSVGFQGGFEGMNPAQPRSMGDDISATNTAGFDVSGTSAGGYTAYKRAIDILSNDLEYDFNMLFTPGLLYQYHSAMIDYAIEMCETRGDALYIFDVAGKTSTIDSAINLMQTMNTNYAATYFPWCKVAGLNNRNFWVPAATVVAEAFAFNDRVSYEWWAPAGLNRGGLTSVIETAKKFKRSHIDDLTEGRINPIASFPNEGIAVWGQKTLQVKASALDRVNVRRLLIKIKKFISSTTKYLVFDQNTTTMRKEFENTVNPYLEDIQQKQGLYLFKVVMDETNNTNETIDRYEAHGELWIQPTKTAEKFIIDINITPTGASFGSI